MNVLSKKLGFSCLLFMSLTGCMGAIFGVPTVVATEIAPRAVNGKGLAEDGADEVTGKDCRVIESTMRKDRNLCESPHSAETKKDFKGL